jgi:uncharacterized protein YjbJ (UPF0337 family)
MNTLAIKGRWNIVSGRLQQKLAELLEDEPRFMQGKQVELIGRIQQQAGKTGMPPKRSLRDYWRSHHQ